MPADIAEHHTIDARQINSSFYDPGFMSDSNSAQYYLYSSGPGFPVSKSKYPESSYSQPQLSMWEYEGGRNIGPAIPPWVGSLAVDNHQSNLWAPDVFWNGSEYVMYFTAWDKIEKVNCIGQATSDSPTGNFVYQNSHFFCDSQALSGYVAIDPTEYGDGRGHRYLVFKATLAGNATVPWEIKYVKLNSAGTAMASAKQDSMITAHAQMEAPSLIGHGTRLWLFAARANYIDCSYYTDAWASPNGITGHFSQVVPHLMIQTDDTKTRCGPGGADVVRGAGGAYYLAYHVWQGGTGRTTPTGTRVTWVTQLGWKKPSSGRALLEN